MGRWREATALYEAAVEIAHAGGYVAAELRARSNLAGELYQQDPARSLGMQLANLELARRVGDRTMAVWIAIPASIRRLGSRAETGTPRSPSPTRHSPTVGRRSTRHASTAPAASSSSRTVSRRTPSSASSRPSRPRRATRARPATRLFLPGGRGDGPRRLPQGVPRDDGRRPRLEGTATFYLAEAIRPALWMRDRDRARATLERLDGHPDASPAPERHHPDLRQVQASPRSKAGPRRR